MILRHQQRGADSSHLILSVIPRLCFVGLCVAAVCVCFLSTAFEKLVALRPCLFSSVEAELLQGLFTRWAFSAVPGLCLCALEAPPRLHHGFVLSPQTAHRA